MMGSCNRTDLSRVSSRLYTEISSMLHFCFCIFSTFRSFEEATSRGSDSKDLKEEAEETRAELTDVEDRNEAGPWQGLNLNRMQIPEFSGTDAIRIGTATG